MRTPATTILTMKLTLYNKLFNTYAVRLSNYTAGYEP
jgi:hypothetical protein